MVKKFKDLAIGDEFLVTNKVSGEVRHDCPVRTKTADYRSPNSRSVTSNVSYVWRNRTFLELFKDDDEVVVEDEYKLPLYDADPNCKHIVRAKEMHEGGGVICRKCGGWFCY